MAEVVALGASIIAIVQIADRVIALCIGYIETIHDAPSDLRARLIETPTTKSVLENVGFLLSFKNEQSTMLENLSRPDGPIQGCKAVMDKMEAIFPSEYSQGSGNNRSKRQKAKACWEYLAWPSKAERAKKLVDELGRFKMTISFALAAESMQVFFVYQQPLRKPSQDGLEF